MRGNIEQVLRIVFDNNYQTRAVRVIVSPGGKLERWPFW
jgi:hypothetical protein